MANPLIPQVLAALRRVLPPRSVPYPLHEPTFGGREIEYVSQCISEGWVSSVGSQVTEFERRLAAFTGVDHAVAVVNGTAALHLSIRLAGAGPGDEVLAPALTFVATANAIAYAGAVPHFVDSEPESLGVDPHKLADHLRSACVRSADGLRNRATGRRIAALVVMHAFGHPAMLDELRALCADYDLPLIEDAAESLGSQYKSAHTGRHGRLAALSFNGNKIITTGGGGAVLTSDPELGARARRLATTAKREHAWDYVHDEIGYNYRLPNINAALGCAQMEQLADFVERKRALAASYEQALQDVPGVRFFREPVYARSNYWLNAVTLDDDSSGLRDELLRTLHADGILARPAWRLMHHLPMYATNPRMDLAVAERIERTLINLPSSMSLALADA